MSRNRLRAQWWSLTHWRKGLLWNPSPRHRCCQHMVPYHYQTCSNYTETGWNVYGPNGSVRFVPKGAPVEQVGRPRRRVGGAGVSPTASTTRLRFKR